MANDTEPTAQDRFLYLGGPVEHARSRARLVALGATLLYALFLFSAVMLAHRWTDPEVQTASIEQPVKPTAKHRF